MVLITIDFNLKGNYNSNYYQLKKINNCKMFHVNDDEVAARTAANKDVGPYTVRKYYLRPV